MLGDLVPVSGTGGPGRPQGAEIVEDLGRQWILPSELNDKDRWDAAVAAARGACGP